MFVSSQDSSSAACISPGTVVPLADGVELAAECLPGTCCVSGLSQAGEPLSIPVTVVRYPDAGVLPGLRLLGTPKMAMLSDFHLLFWKAEDGAMAEACRCEKCHQFGVAGYRSATAGHLPQSAAARASNSGMYWYHLVPVATEHADCVFQLTGQYWSEFLRHGRGAATPLAGVLNYPAVPWQVVP